MKATIRVVLTQDSSLKLIAWAYGHSKKNSEEERQLREALLSKADELICRPPQSDEPLR